MVVVGGEPIALAITHTVAQFEGFLQVFIGEGGLAKIEISGSQGGVGGSEIWIERYGMFEIWNCGIASFFLLRLSAQGKKFDGFERGSCVFTEGSIELLNTGERFAEPRAELGGCSSQSFQDLLFVGRRDLLLCESIAGLAIDGIDADHVFAAQAGDGTGNVGLGGGALADIARE